MEQVWASKGDSRVIRRSRGQAPASSGPASPGMVQARNGGRDIWDEGPQILSEAAKSCRNHPLGGFRAHADAGILRRKNGLS